MNRHAIGLLVSFSLLSGCVQSDSAVSRCQSDDDCENTICENGRCVSLDANEDVQLDAENDVINTDADAENDPEITDTDPEDSNDISDSDLIEPGSFGAPCEINADCDFDYCVATDYGDVCTVQCTDSCPDDDWECRFVGDGGDSLQICLPIIDMLCSHCTNDSNCGALEDYCVELAGSSICTQDCANEDCPENYRCENILHNGETVQQCLPILGDCDGCLDLDNDNFGEGPNCAGFDCNDQDSTIYDGAVEICDGKDNDCNNFSDDGFNFSTDHDNCGGCGINCAASHATTECISGACQIIACLDDYEDIDNEWENGCEFVCVPNPETNGLEICNGIDDDCDDLIDEDFDLENDGNHCGMCNNVCNAEGATTMACETGDCVILTCENGLGNCDTFFSTGCEQDVSSDPNNCGGCGLPCNPTGANGVCEDAICSWDICLENFYDIDGDPANGCEYSCTQNGIDIPDLDFIDANCDGIDGDPEYAIFVATDGENIPLLDGGGTPDRPMLTISYAIEQASGDRMSVYVSAGTYTEQLILRDSVSIWGGFSRTENWHRDASNTTILRWATTTSQRVETILGTNISQVTIGNLQIEAEGTADASTSIYGIRCVGCSEITLERNVIIAGAGGDGIDGDDGSDGHGGSDCNGGVGGSGSDDGSGDGASGGTAGINSVCLRNGGAGGRGGNEGNHAGIAGDPGGIGGTAGSAGWNNGCGAGPGGTGGNGNDGTDPGTHGDGGQIGEASSGFWIPGFATDGTNGDHGHGGGGGGGGDGQGRDGLLDFCIDGYGNGGGGGAAGGCGGLGGEAGTHGGSSFGVFLVDGSDIQISQCSISAENGGDGGNGGDGRNGGAGGGGAGGHSIAIYQLNSDFTQNENQLSHGSAGDGGRSDGNPGSDGIAVNTN